MALRADFDAEIMVQGRKGLELAAADAGDRDLVERWMDTFFHAASFKKTLAGLSWKRSGWQGGKLDLLGGTVSDLGARQSQRNDLIEKIEACIVGDTPNHNLFGSQIAFFETVMNGVFIGRGTVEVGGALSLIEVFHRAKFGWILRRFFPRGITVLRR